MGTVVFFRLGALAQDSALGNFSLGVFVWQPSLGRFCLRAFSWELFLGASRLGSKAGNYSLGDGETRERELEEPSGGT